MSIIGIILFFGAFFLFLGKSLPLFSEKMETGWLCAEDEAELKKQNLRALLCLILGLSLILLDLLFYF